jgi:hypothetical protein
MTDLVDDPVSILSQILRNMRTNSKMRGHEFDRRKAIIKMIEALEKILYNSEGVGLCGCGRCVDTMILNCGVAKLGFDRLLDFLGYGDDGQELTVVKIAHNTWMKPTTEKIIRTGKTIYFLGQTSDSMVANTKGRADKLFQRRRKGLPLTPSENEQLNLFNREYFGEEGNIKLREQYKEILKEKVANLVVIWWEAEDEEGRKEGESDWYEYSMCPRCGELIHCGIVRTRWKGTKNSDIYDIRHLKYMKDNMQASPDRLDNDNIYYWEDNYELVCPCCQETDGDKGKTYYRRAEIPLTREHVAQMIRELKERH